MLDVKGILIAYRIIGSGVCVIMGTLVGVGFVLTSVWVIVMIAVGVVVIFYGFALSFIATKYRDEYLEDPNSF
jgi:hypothetical protein